MEPFHLGLAAGASARAGRHDEARAYVAQAFASLAAGNDLALASELHRIRAMLSSSGGATSRDAAEEDLRRALEIARQQEDPRCSCALRMASPMYWPGAASAGKRSTSSARSTAGSPRASGPLI